MVLIVSQCPADQTMQLNPKPLPKDRRSNTKDHRSRRSSTKDCRSWRSNTKDCRSRRSNTIYIVHVFGAKFYLVQNRLKVDVTPISIKLIALKNWLAKTPVVQWL